MADLPAVPDYYGQFMAPIQRQQQLDMQQQQSNIELQQAKLQTAAYLQKLQQAQQYQQDAAQTIANPTPEGYRNLLLKYPEMHDSIKDAWGQASEQQRDSDVKAASQVYAALQNGRTDLALSLLKDRQTAQRSAGTDDKVTDDAITALESGDPAKIKQIQGMAGMVLATSAGPDKVGPMLDSLNSGQYTLGEGETRFDRSGNIIAQSPFLKGADGATYERDAPGAGAATPSAAASAGGMQASVAHVLGNEGGYNPKDANGSPTNFGINYKANAGILKSMGITPANFKNMTKEQAEQIYAAKYWPQSGADKLPTNLQAPYFDVYVRSPALAKRALAQSGGDPQKFMQIASANFQAMANKPGAATAPYKNAWANRDAGNMAIATGATAASRTAAPNAPPGYHLLVPPGPDKPPTGFEPDPNKPGALRPIAGGPADTTADQMDPETVNFYAQEILSGTPMSQLSFGMGKAAALNRRQVMTQVAKLAGAEGLSGRDLAVQLTHYKAASANVAQLEKQAGTIQANEQTALTNGQQFLDRSRELSGQTSFPIVNSITQSYLRHTGDPTIAAMDAAWNTFSTEYAKVVAGSPSGAGTLSDSARHEAMDIMRGNYSLAQKQAAFAQMKTDMSNRMAAIHGSLQNAYTHMTDRAPELQGRSSPKGGQSAGPPASAVQYLRQHPNLRAAFDAKYGSGASARALGGQ